MAFREICPAGPGYQYSASALQFNQRATEQLGNRGVSLVTHTGSGNQGIPLSIKLQPVLLLNQNCTRFCCRVSVCSYAPSFPGVRTGTTSSSSSTSRELHKPSTGGGPDSSLVTGSSRGSTGSTHTHLHTQSRPSLPQSPQPQPQTPQSQPRPQSPQPRPQSPVTGPQTPQSQPRPHSPPSQALPQPRPQPPLTGPQTPQSYPRPQSPQPQPQSPPHQSLPQPWPQSPPPQSPRPLSPVTRPQTPQFQPRPQTPPVQREPHPRPASPPVSRPVQPGSAGSTTTQDKPWSPNQPRTPQIQPDSSSSQAAQQPQTTGRQDSGLFIHYLLPILLLPEGLHFHPCFLTAVLQRQ